MQTVFGDFAPTALVFLLVALTVACARGIIKLLESLQAAYHGACCEISEIAGCRD